MESAEGLIRWFLVVDEAFGWVQLHIVVRQIGRSGSLGLVGICTYQIFVQRPVPYAAFVCSDTPPCSTFRPGCSVCSVVVVDPGEICHHSVIADDEGANFGRQLGSGRIVGIRCHVQDAIAC